MFNARTFISIDVDISGIEIDSHLFRNSALVAAPSINDDSVINVAGGKLKCWDCDRATQFVIIA
jgi:hypothetical protein